MKPAPWSFSSLDTFDWRTMGEDQPIEHKRGIHD